MRRLNDTLKQKITEAINEAERQSSCEFVSVITQKSGNYRIYAFFAAVSGALIIPHLIHFFAGQLDIGIIMRTQIVLVIVFMALTQLSFVTKNLVPSFVKRRQASLVASESFRKFGLYRTQKRRAILFFVSLDEKYATIMTDIGIEEKIPAQRWESVIDDFRLKLESEDVALGYLDAIRTCGELLKREFPAEEGDIDELPNELIIA